MILMESTQFIMSAPSGDITPTVAGTPAPRLVAGKMGSALRLEGAELNYGKPTAECFFDTNLCVNGLSVSLWVKFYTISDTSDSMIFADGGHYADGKGLSVYRHKDGFITVHISDDSHLRYGTTTEGDIFHWQHIVFTWEGGSTTIALYQNGCPDIHSSWLADRHPLATSYDFTIGGNLWGGIAARGNIALDHVLMWYEPLTPENVWQLYIQGGRVW